MKTKAQSAALSGKKLRPAARLQSPARLQQPQTASSQPTPEARGPDALAIKEHLRVQREIEERARRLWCAAGSPTAGAINHWLKAEDEVLAEFVKSRKRRQPEPALKGTQKATGGKPALPPAIPGQLPPRLNLNSTSAFQSQL